MTYLVAQLGARMHYGVPRILYAGGQLAEFHTDICSDIGLARLLNIVPAAMLPRAARRLRSRTVVGVPKRLIRTQTALGFRYAISRASVKGSVDSTLRSIQIGQEFCRSIADSANWDVVSNVYAFNSAALEVFVAARSRRIRTVLEQTIAPRVIESQLLARFGKIYPLWDIEHERSNDSASRFAARESEEWELADLILCGSEFVREGVLAAGGPVDRCVVVPYGVGSAFSCGQRRNTISRPLRVLSVGAINLRKGSPIVAAVAAALHRKCEFRSIGPADCGESALQEFQRHVDTRGVIPRGEMRAQYAWADVFLLPSICEGSATVTYEALVAGLPVVCTPNTGSMVLDGQDGIIVDAENVDGFIAAISRLADNRELVATMSQRALDNSYRAMEAAYAMRLIEALGVNARRVS